MLYLYVFSFFIVECLRESNRLVCNRLFLSAKQLGTVYRSVRTYKLVFHSVRKYELHLDVRKYELQFAYTAVSDAVRCHGVIQVFRK